ncbi:two component transcriptional regulator, winged helix family [Clostridium bornimense]|uniref:Heme response regulator HssR n=1 Tax=Clostridium bornimense TaxID=1216932 RepID=W6RW76_9CLOT|nr:response regulator transcription factor [Clostridium bornimense]CDM68911.1 two component transcriptional regulator, winged helix family [Clostridium bornimense]
MVNILVVEDDKKICQLFCTVLSKNGFNPLKAFDGVEAFDVLENKHIDLVISDIMMPNMDGYEFTKSLREINSDIPILMITAKDDFPSKEKSFLIGIDDYMVKPIDVNEMILRVDALLRRSKIVHDRQQTIGETLLDYDSLSVTRNGEVIVLPQKEFYLLYKLISYPNKIFTRNQIMNEIWGIDSPSDSQTIDVHINRLRRHFGNNPDFEIVTVRGLGYKVIKNE